MNVSTFTSEESSFTVSYEGWRIIAWRTVSHRYYAFVPAFINFPTIS
jgi:hypothetical protein